MAYIWINPVVDRMYSSEVLNEFLSKHGYKRFYTTSDWITIVKEKYRLSVEKAAYPVMDMRCPKIKNMLEELGITSKVTIPAINPILIHCGEEGSKREDLQSEEKIITTPCQALADMGNALGLKDTKFIAWNRFVELIGEEPRGNILEASPIPPGFFSELGVKTVSITGEEDIRNYLKENLCKNTSDNGLNENKESLENKGLSGNDVQLVEMLFCKNGCHNGDGVRISKIGERRQEKKQEKKQEEKKDLGNGALKTDNVKMDRCEA